MPMTMTMNGGLPPSTPKTSGIIKNTLFMNNNDELNTPSYTSNTGSRNNPPRNTGMSIDNLLNQPSSSSSNQPSSSSNPPSSSSNPPSSSSNPPSNTGSSNNPPRNTGMSIDNLLNQPSSSSSNTPSNTHGNLSSSSSSSNNTPSNTHGNLSSNNLPSNTHGNIRNNLPSNTGMSIDNLLNQPSSSSNPPSSSSNPPSSSSNPPSSSSNTLDNSGGSIEFKYTTDNISNVGRQYRRETRPMQEKRMITLLENTVPLDVPDDFKNDPNSIYNPKAQNNPTYIYP
jgi:hypothetical protein